MNIPQIRVEKGYFNSKYLEKERYTKGLMAGLVQAKDTKLPLFRIFSKRQQLEEYVSGLSENAIRIVAHPGEDLPRIGEYFDGLSPVEESKEDATPDYNANVGMEMSLDGQTHDSHIEEAVVMERKHFVLMIGPEGGWIDEELEMFKKYGFAMCSLGARVLRTGLMFDDDVC